MNAVKTDFRLRKQERLSGKRAFDRVFAEGKLLRGRCVVLRALPNGLKQSRLGLSVGAKVGSAVKRNRVKRLLREAYRLNKHVLSVPCDLVAVPRPGFSEKSLQKVERDLVSLLGKFDAAFAGKQSRR